MATQITRPIANVLKSWLSSDYTYIDDVVTNPTIAGLADFNQANKNDANEIERYACETISHATVSDIEINLLAGAYDTSASNLVLSGNYIIGGSTGVAKTWNVPSQAVTPVPDGAYAWYQGTWSGLNIPMIGDNRILIGVGAMAQPKLLNVAVAYLKLTYTLGTYLSIVGGDIVGGDIR